MPLGDDGLRLDVREPDDESETISTDTHGDHVHIHGEAAGETAVVFELVDDGSVEWDASEPIEVVVE